MKRNIITVLLISTIISMHPLAIQAAEDAILSPTPTLLITESITPSPSAYPNEHETLTPTTIPSSTAPNTIDTIKSEAIQNMDNSVIESNIVNQTAVSGNNRDDNGDITTGDSTASASIDNQLNTNVIGSDNWLTLINQFSNSDNDIDLSKIVLPSDLQQVLKTHEYTDDGVINKELYNKLSKVIIDNSAVVTNTVSLQAKTGDNKVQEGVIKTGTAEAKLNLSNIVNTNIIGDSTFFGVINLFGSQSGDIVLPYELDFIKKDDTANGYILNTINNANHSEISSDLSVTANSGNNTANKILTDPSITKIQQVDITNTNIVGSNFLLLYINDYGEWNGTVQGWWGDAEKNNNQTVLSFSNSSSNSSDNSLHMHITNVADLTNHINLEADSGNNTAEGNNSSIQTGSAKAAASIFNLVNTTIIGNNWFYGIVNIFDHFTGNIIFPRPDLSIYADVSSQEIRAGNEQLFTITFRNQGTTAAKDVTVVTNLSDGLDFISLSGNGLYENHKLSWNINSLMPDQSMSVFFKARVNNTIPGTISQLFEIYNRRDEPNLTNNTYSLSFTISNPPDTSRPVSQVTTTPSPPITVTPEMKKITVKEILLIDNSTGQIEREKHSYPPYEGRLVCNEINTVQKKLQQSGILDIQFFILSQLFLLGYSLVEYRNRLSIEERR